jgi:Domain of unknown function (DUF6378)
MLEVRSKTHGPFASTAAIAQSLKAILREGPNWHRLRPVQREALEMIATKVARILSGDASFADHLADIAGYAKLGEG